MLVADALDVVLAKAVAQQGRALAGLDRDNARAVVFLEIIACRQCSRRPRSRDKSRQAQTRVPRADCIEDARQRRSGAGVMGDVIAELGELIEDYIRGILRELGAFVVYFLDVALRAGGPNDVFGPGDPGAQPL